MPEIKNNMLVRSVKAEKIKLDYLVYSSKFISVARLVTDKNT
jgi:hypothetical protein